MTTPIRYERDGRIARITLDRPDKANALTDETPAAIREAVERAEDDPDARVVVLAGAGEHFCAGYDLERFAEEPRPTTGSQEMPWDPMEDLEVMESNTRDLMSLWESRVPVVARVHGDAVGGGSDLALCADVVLVAEDARIGYPPAQVWGCPTTAMWVYRVGPEDAKRMLLTGDLVDGAEAERMGLVHRALPRGDLDEAVETLASRMAQVPSNQLAMMKTLVNQSVEQMGLPQAQRLATLFDGMARHSPEGVAFKERCEEVGWEQAVAERDEGTLLEDEAEPD
jgi:enoyl-CoA hydratase